MGLRTASARRPHVMVMAPALTKSSQSQSFKLTENNSPSSPATTLSTRNSEHDQFDPYDKDEKRRQFNHTDLENATDNLNTLALVSELLKNNCYIGNISTIGGSSDPSGIMNSSPLHMGDHKDKMGLQKVGLDVNSLIKDKSSGSDVDQLFNNLESDIGVSSDTVQNVDELMQVFKSIGAGSDRLGGCPSELGTEADSIFPLSSTDLTSNFSSLEKELFNDVDVMNMSMEEQLLDGANTLKENHTNEFLLDLQKKHVKLERKLEFLLRRLRKIQAQHMGQHISEQVAGVFEEVHRSLRHPKNIQQQLDQTTVNFAPSEDTANNTMIYPEKLKPICRSSAKALIRKLKLSTDSQASSIVKQRPVPQYFGSGSTERCSSLIRKSLVGVTTVPPWNIEFKHDLQKVTGLLYTETKLVQQEIDSEATVSSSGGESCDEMQTYNNSQQQYLALSKRAAWRYAKERAAVACRWTWLKAQIGDLEYRIRQYSDLYKQIRASKGSVRLGGLSPPQSISPSPTTVNGYLGQLPGATSKALDSTNANGVLGANDIQCSRTRPLLSFRKRKLLQTWGLHAVSKKAARPATIRCGCIPPNLQCALCTGRTDPTRPRDHPDYLSQSERISLLDSSFHPVFSLREDASASIHLEAIMKTLEWQQRSSKPNIKAVKLLSKGTDKFISGDQVKKQPDHRRKYNRLIKPSTINALTAKIKNKLRGRKPGLHSMSRIRRKRHSEKLALSHLQVPMEGVNEEIDQINFRNKVETRSLSPLLGVQAISNYKRSGRGNSYDIDNIVIPYSVAAATRVEKLPYKEILTPKWRIIDPDLLTKYKNNGLVEDLEQQESDNEDLLEEAVVLRHEKCEHDEKKKFLSYLKFPYGYGRSRAHKRTDSQAESSGCNTPDPMSPHGETLENTVSPITSPPATPVNINTEDTVMLSSNLIRKRTISQSRGKDKEMLKEEPFANTTEFVEVFPYDRRFFPLSEDTYDKMLKLMPENHQFKTNYRAQDCTSPSSYVHESVHSPDSESTESAVGDEDPNDPEWIDMETIKERYRR